MPRSDLPFGSEFSPSQISLPRLLEFSLEAEGDWHVFEDKIRAEFFESHATNEYNRRKLANNAKLGMQAYGIVDREGASLTDFGRSLYDLRTDDFALYSALGRRILRHLHGAALVQCVLDMQAAGEDVTLLSLRRALGERGIHFPRGGKHPSIMRLWLEKAGVFRDGWRVDQTRFESLLGASLGELDSLASLSQEQRSFLRALVSLGTEGQHTSNDIERLANRLYGTRFDEKNLPKQVLYPLRDTGFIVLERGTREPGRGAKPFLVKATEQLRTEVLLPLLEQLEQQIGAEQAALLRKPIAEIMGDLTADSKHTRGLALEALAFKLMRLLDMRYVATRLRASASGGAEVDLIVESARLVFSRWQLQCKNTRYVALDDVAKEVGLVQMLKSNVIVVVGTGRIAEPARKFARKVMADTNLCVVLVDGEDITRICENPSRIVDVFEREAKEAMRLKRLEIEGVG